MAGADQRAPTGWLADRHSSLQSGEQNRSASAGRRQTSHWSDAVSNLRRRERTCRIPPPYPCHRPGPRTGQPACPRAGATATTSDGPGGRWTITGQAAMWSRSWLVDPSRSPLKPPRPREPTTTNPAARDASASTVAGVALTHARLDPEPGVVPAEPLDQAGDHALRGPVLPSPRARARARARSPPAHGGRSGVLPRGQDDQRRVVPARRAPRRSPAARADGLRVVHPGDDGHLRPRRHDVALADDGHRAAGVRADRPRHRPQEQPGQRAPAAVADDDQLGRPRGLDQRRRRPVEDRRGADLQPRRPGPAPGPRPPRRSSSPRRPGRLPVVPAPCPTAPGGVSRVLPGEQDRERRATVRAYADAQSTAATLRAEAS